MSLFAPKCDRCGTRTRNEDDGRPVCSECVKEMELKTQAAAEELRRCPVDGAAMKKEVAHMSVIDRCPDCGGIWLDGGELSVIEGDLQADAVVAMSKVFTLGM